MGKQKNTVIIVIIIALLTLISISIYNLQENLAVEKARQEADELVSTVTQKITDVCLEYGMTDIKVNVEFFDGHDHAYEATIDAQMEPLLEGADLLQCISDINDVSVDGWIRYGGICDRHYINDHLFYIESGKLYIGNGVYYDPSPREKIDIDDAFNVPYEGMDANLVELTDLGEADDVEYCRDYAKLEPDHQSITYRWYYDNGKLAFYAHTLNGKVISVTDYRK